MDLEQFVADSTENTSIARYHALYSGGGGAVVSVECGMCGMVQPERRRPGARWIEMECLRCGLRTRAGLTGGADPEPQPGLDACWFDDLDPRDRGGG